MQHVCVDGWEVSDAANLLLYALDPATYDLRGVLALIVARSVDVVATSGWLSQLPVPKPHVIATSDGIVRRPGTLQ
jgi:hypothetical protein